MLSDGTVNFSVPEDVKEAVNTAFKGQITSAITTELMREAVELARQKQQSHDAIGRILERRQRAPRLSESEIIAAREKERP